MVACNQKDPDEATTDDDTDEPSTDTDDEGSTDTGSDPTTDEPTTDETDPVTEPTDSDPTDTNDTGSDTSEPTDTSVDAGGPTETEPPASSDGTTEPPPPGMEIPEEEMLEYFPLIDGATWTYRHSKTNEAAWNEITTMIEGVGADEGSFVLTDSPDRQNDVTTQWWKRVGSAVMRVQREETRNGSLRSRTTYDPGFTRFDTLWSSVGFEQEITYTHVETDVNGSITSERSQHFEVLEIDASVTIDSTTYDNCIQIARTRPDTMDVGHYWFAKGIGKIKEVDPDSLTTEELIAFDIP